MKQYIKIIKLVILAALILAVGLVFYIHKWEYRKAELEVNFLSLDRGRAVFIRTPGNKTILIGGGQNSQVIREITRNTPFYNRKIDMVVIPAATLAQIGGLIEVLNRYEVEKIFISKIMATSTVLAQVQKEIRKNKIRTVEVQKGDIVDIEEGLNLEILFPYEEFKFNKTSLPELGMVLKYENTGLYLLGNLSKTIQKDILKNHETQTEENILELYNTGAETKISEDLLEMIQPKYIFTTNEKTTRWVSNGEEWNEY